MTAAPALLLLLAATPYVRARASTEPGAHCLWWGERQITWTQNTAGNPATGTRTFDSVGYAFDSWNQALAGCSELTFTQGARSNSRKTGWEAGGAAGGWMGTT